MTCPRFGAWWIRGTTRSVRGVVVLAFAATLSGEARALVVRECVEQQCGFSFPSLRDCELTPQNHRLLLQVDCADEIPPESYPRIRTDDGGFLAGNWEPVAVLDEDRFYGDARRFEYVGDALPLGEELQLGGTVPSRCAAAFVGDLGEDAACASPTFEGDDCCSSFAWAGWSFGGLESLPPEEPGGAPPGFIEYVRFVVGPPDVEAPAVVVPRLSCVYQEPLGQVLVEFDQPLAGVESVRLDFSGTSPDLEATVVPTRECAVRGSDGFRWHPFRFGAGVGDFSVRITAKDWAGNETAGPWRTLQVPEDCEPPGEFPYEGLPCTDSGRTVSPECAAPGRPTIGEELGVCGEIGESSSEWSPNFSTASGGSAGSPVSAPPSGSSAAAGGCSLAGVGGVPSATAWMGFLSLALALGGRRFRGSGSSVRG